MAGLLCRLEVPPGLVSKGPLNLGPGGRDGKLAEARWHCQPWQVAGQADHPTGAIVFLANDAAALMTGSTLLVDGGRTAD